MSFYQRACSSSWLPLEVARSSRVLMARKHLHLCTLFKRLKEQQAVCRQARPFSTQLGCTLTFASATNCCEISPFRKSLSRRLFSTSSTKLSILEWLHSPQQRPRILLSEPKASLDCSGQRYSVRFTSTDARLSREEDWMVQKKALDKKFGGQSWEPPKRLSPDAMEGVRALHAQDPGRYSTETLAEQFKVSAEAVRRILKSKWRPTEDEQADRQRRWVRRGERIWSDKVTKGIKPPKKWREMGIKADSAHSNLTGKTARKRSAAWPRKSGLDIGISTSHIAVRDETTAGHRASLSSKIL